MNFDFNHADLTYERSQNMDMRTLFALSDTERSNYAISIMPRLNLIGGERGKWGDGEMGGEG
ncbi:MAG TPA: hypothetical protein DD379_02780, partial [Cyanobacteria bacterium UBA11162]|nr:hypothetical protein [Cyanobacteria bacterium UBA11162]